MNTMERLESYAQFDDNVLAQVEELDAMQRNMTAGQFFDFAGIPQQPTMHEDSNGNLISLYDIVPQDCDPSSAIVMNLEMAQPLDRGLNAYKIATVAAANKNQRLLVAGKPALAKFGEGGRIAREDFKAVSFGNFIPTVMPMVEYIDGQGITSLKHFGGSAGADGALATVLAHDNNIESTHLVAIEPASSIKRPLPALLVRFMQTNGALSDYYEANGLDGFTEARRDPSTARGMAYNLGIPLLSNIVTGQGIARGNFSTHLSRAMQSNPDMQVMWAHVDKSELAGVDVVSKQIAILNGLATRNGRTPVDELIAHGRHSILNDMSFLAAVSLQGFAPKSKN